MMKPEPYYSEHSTSLICTTGGLLAPTSAGLNNYSRQLATKGTRYTRTLERSEPEQIQRQ